MSDRIEEAAKIIDELEWSRLDYATLGEQVAKALAKAGLLATREEWSAAYVGVTADGTRTLNPIGTEGTRDHAEDTRDDCANDDPGTRFFLARRGYTEWEAVE